jgi:hypothetical protein
MLPMQSIDLAIAEMRFARKLSFRGGFLRPNPYNNKMIHHPTTSHSGPRPRISISRSGSRRRLGGMPTVGVDRFEGRARAAHNRTRWNDAGLHERHLGRRLRASPSASPFSDGRRLDRAVARPDGPAFRRPGLQRFRPHARPSELFRRNCWISFAPVEGSLKVLADYIGPHKILWATDYPPPTASSGVRRK